MPVELMRDLVKIDKVVGQVVAQAIIEGDILVPDTKPDITRILSIDGTVQLTKEEVSENNIAVEGIIQFKILYVSDKGEQPLYSIDSSTGFKQNIEIQGLSSKMKGKVAAEIEHIDYNINHERKIAVKAVLNFHGKGIEEVQLEVTSDLTGIEDIQILKEKFKYTEVIGVNTSETLVKDSFELEEDHLEVKDILKWDAVVLERETKITDGKVIVGGTVFTELLYITEENSLNVFKKEMAFTHFVEISGAFSDMQYKLGLSVEELHTEIRENIQGERKIIEIEAIVKVHAEVMDTQEREIVTDAYSPSVHLKPHKNQIKVSENIGINRAYVQLRETLETPANHPPMERVFSVNAKPVLTDYSFLEDKVVVEGVVETTAIYNTVEGIQPFYSFVQEIPFRHFVEIDGLDQDAEANIELFVEQVDYHLLNGEQIEIKVNVSAHCEVYLEKIFDLIVNIEEVGEPVDVTKKPSLTIYYFQPGDSLWKIAKKYQTTVKQIMESNGIEKLEEIKPGDHIIIEKVHKFHF